MSHFTTLVCLPKGTDLADHQEALDRLLAPFDENTPVQPYRSYEDGAAEDHYLVQHLRQAAEHHVNGTGTKPHDPQGATWSSSSSRDTLDEQRNKIAYDAGWAAELGPGPVTWSQVVELYAAYYHGVKPGQLAKLNESTPKGELEGSNGEESDWLYYDSELDRAYAMTTYNPESKWDWWQVGGRWKNYFHAKQGVDRSALIGGGVDADSRWELGFKCDGGPVGLLDFEAMRAEKEAEAHAQYDAWERVSAEQAHHGKPVTWEHFYSQVQAGDLTIDQARARYNAQPILKPLGEALYGEDARFRGVPLEDFQVDRATYAETARVEAVPPYAILTAEGEWQAPGKMGWFGMSSETPDSKRTFKELANTYLAQLDPEQIVVLCDLHI